jgi:hypothetical protein
MHAQIIARSLSPKRVQVNFGRSIHASSTCPAFSIVTNALLHDELSWYDTRDSVHEVQSGQEQKSDIFSNEAQLVGVNSASSWLISQSTVNQNRKLTDCTET